MTRRWFYPPPPPSRFSPLKKKPPIIFMRGGICLDGLLFTPLPSSVHCYEKEKKGYLNLHLRKGVCHKMAVGIFFIPSPHLLAIFCLYIYSPGLLK